MEPKIAVVVPVYKAEKFLKGCLDSILEQSFGDIKDRAEKDLVLTPEMKPDFRYDTDHSVYVQNFY